jgi:Xaa-Pro aminopeptidase
MNGTERIQRVLDALREKHLDLVVCSLPMNVLLLSGYWPVVGASVAIASADGRIILLAPKDEEQLARSGWADRVNIFRPGSLDQVITTAEAIAIPLRAVAASFSQSAARIGYEALETTEPVTYSAMHLYGGSMPALLRDAFPKSTLVSADEMLSDLRARKTGFEIGRIRLACEMAARAFLQGSQEVRVGKSEVEAANAFCGPLGTSLADFPDVERAGGFAWCMSGANSALAAGAYARSRCRRMEHGDLALVHCNSYADGYWTDITRTYTVGDRNEQQRRIYDAVFAAREAAFARIAPGALAADLDTAAREVLRERGFGPEFKHGTGHGVGFGAISSGDKPLVHPKSTDVLESGMVFNVEPAVYVDGYGGVRHCDMVAVTDDGYELLTPFQCKPEELVLHSEDEPAELA